MILLKNEQINDGRLIETTDKLNCFDYQACDERCDKSIAKTLVT